MNDFNLTTPVVLIIFNRPDTTAQVFEEIAKAKPPKLLVIGDGPRGAQHSDAERVAAARDVIRRVDWNCEVETNFYEDNRGAKVRISTGLDWAFSRVSEAIIFEDDCLPEPSFFRFCQEMLEYYRSDQRVSMISGDNYQFGRRRNDDSYYFSRYGHIWGWATWRDRWAGYYDVEMAKWPRIRDEGWIDDLVGSKNEAAYWRRIFESTYRGEYDAWDYQWVFTNWLEGRCAVVPAVNLVSNIGFNKYATNTKGASELANVPRSPLEFPLRHPLGRFRNLAADDFSYRKCFGLPLLKRLRNKLAALI